MLTNIDMDEQFPDIRPATRTAPGVRFHVQRAPPESDDNYSLEEGPPAGRPSTGSGSRPEVHLWPSFEGRRRSLRRASGLAGTPIRAYNDALFGAGHRSPPGGGRTGMPAGAENRASDKSRKSHAIGISTKGSSPEAVSFLIDSVAFFMKSGCSSAW